MSTRSQARNRVAQQKLKGLSDPPESKVVRLKCGHATGSAPIVSGVRSLWRCPFGCGLQGSK